MAAKNEGFQEFPLATFTVPPREQMEELSAMTQNFLEGHQGIGEGTEDDPYTRAVRYLEKHRIVEILQNLTSRIAYERPENPLQFLLKEMAQVQRGETLRELSSSPMLPPSTKFELTRSSN